MIQPDPRSDEELDQWLRDAHAELIGGLSAVDIEAGLREVLEQSRANTLLQLLIPQPPRPKGFRYTLKDEPAPDSHNEFKHAWRQMRPPFSFDEDWFGPIDGSAAPFPTPDEVDARWEEKIKPAYDQLVFLVNEQLEEKPRATYSVDIPQGTPEDVIRRVSTELEGRGWCTMRVTNSSKSFIRFCRAAR